RDNRGDPFGMADGDAETGRRAIVEDIDRKAIKSDDFGEAVDDPSDVIESVAELVPRRHVRLAEARQIRSHDMELVGKQRNEVAEHMARAREAVKQKQLGRTGRSRLAIENLHAVYVGKAIFCSGHECHSLKFDVPSVLPRRPGRSAVTVISDN